MSKYKHLNQDQRNIIKLLLDKNYKLKEIAAQIGKDPTTISKEIKANRNLIISKSKRNVCGKQSDCKIKHLCNNCENGICKHCSANNCNLICDDFTKLANCKRIYRYPYTCNSCQESNNCKLPKMFYDAKNAQENYKFNVSDYKKGVKIKTSEFKQMEITLRNGILKGQSIDIIRNNNPKLIPFATSTIYKYIEDEVFADIKAIDLLRKVRYKKRKKKKSSKNKIYKYNENRKYDDFQRYIANNPESIIWEMDTIIGVRDGNQSVILSLLHRESNLQLYFKLKSNTQDEVVKVFDMLKNHLGEESFENTFEVILTDNGAEFKDPISIEQSLDLTNTLTKVFYCMPNRSEQKGQCEKNHEEFRKFIAKNISFNEYTKDDIDHISNNVNNYQRKKLKYLSPRECYLSLEMEPRLLEVNSITRISSNNVTLKPIKK